MLDGGIPKKESENSSNTLLKKANDCVIAVQHRTPPARLFDAFWTEGEMALLFGPTGVGKSVLAVEIADAIARGRRIDGFEMTAKRQRVMYVNLRLTEDQFGDRYTVRGANGDVAYKFSENLYIECGGSPDGLIERVRAAVAEHGIRTIVIDDLAAFRTNGDGVREMMLALRELDRLKREFGLSLLVLVGSREPGWGRDIGERDLTRSRVLCDVADSVFAIGRNSHTPSDVYLLQTRSRTGPIQWTAANAPACRVQRFPSGLLGFIFDRRFSRKVDAATRTSICTVRICRDAGWAYRLIVAATGIPLATVHRLHKMWTPELAEEERLSSQEIGNPYGTFVDVDGNIVVGGIVQAAAASKEEDLCEVEEFMPAADGSTPAEDLASCCDPHDRSVHDDLSTADRFADSPEAAAPFPPENGCPDPDRDGATGDPFAHLTRIVDGYGRDIFVEKFDERGKHIIWYTQNKQGRINRWHRTGGGIHGIPVDGQVCVIRCG